VPKSNHGVARDSRRLPDRQPASDLLEKLSSVAAPSKSPRSIGDYLTERGWISGVELHYARQSQRQLGGRLETCLLAQGALDEAQLLEALSEYQGLPAASGDDLQRADAQALRTVPVEVARRLRAVPFSQVGDELWVAVENAEDEAVQRELALATKLPLRYHVASEPRVSQALETHYGVACSSRIRQLLARLDRPEPLAAATPAVPAAQRSSPPRRPSRQDDSGSMPTISPGALSAFERRLSHLESAQETFATLVDYLGREFQRVAVFRVASDHVEGWLMRAGADAQERLSRYRAFFTEPSVFLNLRQGAPFHLGALPDMATHELLAECLGGPLPAEVLLLPIQVQGRLVAVVYCDRGSRGLAGIDLGELQRMAAATATSLERRLLHQKLRKT
jgi:hypothetical protein